MGKKELAAILYDALPPSIQQKITHEDLEEIVSTFRLAVIRHLRKFERLEWRGFLVMKLKDQKARVGRNPKTGEPVEIKAGRFPTIKLTPSFRREFL